MTKLLGTASPENWADIQEMPDYGKIIFKDQKPIEMKQYFSEFITDTQFQGEDEYYFNVLIEIL